MALRAGDTTHAKAKRDAKAYAKVCAVSFAKARERLYEAASTKIGLPEAIAEYLRTHPRLQGPK